MATASPDGAGSIKPPGSSRAHGRRRTCRGPGCSAGSNSCTSTSRTEALTSPHRCRCARHGAQPQQRRPPCSGGLVRLVRSGPVRVAHACFCRLTGPTQSPGSMRLEAAARMDLFRKLWKARKLVLVVLIPLSLLPLPLIHPTSVSTDTHLQTHDTGTGGRAVPGGAATSHSSAVSEQIQTQKIDSVYPPQEFYHVYLITNLDLIPPNPVRQGRCSRCWWRKGS